MKYKIETLRKLLTAMETLIAFLMTVPLDMIDICISKGNEKIGHVLNVSLPPIKSCMNCAKCMFFCYDIKACLQYPNVLFARCRNYVLLVRDRDKYFELIEDAISRRRTNKYFRWHVSGDIVDYDYFCRMVEIAKKHPEFVFWTYTKNYWIINQYVREHGNDRFKALPLNFIVMFSEWDGVALDNPYNFPIFTCRLKAGNKNHDDSFFESLYKCPGNCDICKKARRGCIAGEDTFADEH